LFTRAVHFRHPFPPVGDAAYCQHAGGGPSNRHRQHAQKFGKDRACASGDILSNRHTDTQDRHDILITILRNRFRGRSIVNCTSNTEVGTVTVDRSNCYKKYRGEGDGSYSYSPRQLFTASDVAYTSLTTKNYA